jgi:hypothetical protein
MIRFLIIFIISFNCNAKTFVIKDYKKYVTQQYGKYWCWAASIESMYRYKNIKMTQFEIMAGFTHLPVEDFEKGKDDVIFGIHPLEFYQKYLNNFTEIKRSEIKKYLHKNKPIIFSNNNHVSLIIGMDKEHFIIMDTDDAKFKRIRFSHILCLNSSYDFCRQSDEPSWFYSF